MIIEASTEAIKKVTEIANELFGYRNIQSILEFGSRYGEDTIEFAKIYPGAQIYAFECNPNTLDNCRKNIRNYSNIILTEKAISDSDGQVSFFKIDKNKTITTWEDGNQGASSMLKSSGQYPIEQYAQEEIKVDSITLNNFIKDKKIAQVDILWMDIQGAELMALHGLKRNISIVKLIHLEVEFMEIYENQPLFEKINSFLKSKNFAFAGFTNYGEYSGDAIFLNKDFITKINVKQLSRRFSLFIPKSKTKIFLAKIFNKLKRLF